LDEQTIAGGTAPMQGRQADASRDRVAPDDGSSIEAKSGQSNSGSIDSGWAPSRPARTLPANPPGPRRKEKIIRLPHPALSPDQSSELRDRLIVALGAIGSSEDASDWAFNNLLAKNALGPEDAKLVETAFLARLAALVDEYLEQPVDSVLDTKTQQELEPLNGGDRSQEGQNPRDRSQTGQPKGAITTPKDAPPALDQVKALPELQPIALSSRHVAAKIIRLRDKEHCKFVATRPCIVCGRLPSDAHHLRLAQPRALGRKVSDEYTVPVCRLHHRELHNYGDEASWWSGVNVDPVPVALALWRSTRGAP
jgi:hypothetical protein